MAKKEEQILDYIDMEEINQILEDDLKQVVTDICTDIRKLSKSVIEGFYADYTPHYYNRKGSLKSVIPYYTITPVEGGYEILAEWESADISNYHKYPHDAYVYNGPFLLGYHGGPHILSEKSGVVEETYLYTPAPQMSPSPWEILLSYIEKEYDGYEI